MYCWANTEILKNYKENKLIQIYNHDSRILFPRYDRMGGRISSEPKTN